jgi:hypothetical protein
MAQTAVRDLRCLAGIAVRLVSDLQAAFDLVARFERHDESLGDEDLLPGPRVSHGTKPSVWSHRRNQWSSPHTTSGVPRRSV